MWCVRDRNSEREYALKVLAADATTAEMDALVREAIALSGLEGLGVPEVQLFGRLPHSGRHFLVREMVHGKSLQQLMEDGGALPTVLLAIARSAEQLTHVHRAGFFHGDIKPANIIVAPSGKTTLVDLGLAAPWRDAGATVRGLTPKYAAPELLQGGSLTARAEVYALGVTLVDALELCGTGEPQARLDELRDVSRRATLNDASQRYPSADEFASALRRVASLGPPQEAASQHRLWPVMGIDGTSARLQSAVAALSPGSSLRIAGAEGSGRSTLLRRLAWSLGVEGKPLAWIDRGTAKSFRAVTAELAAHADVTGVCVLVDDAELVTSETADLIAEAGRAGAVLVLVGEGPLGEGDQVFDVPPLGEHAALKLIQRAIPSLVERLAKRLISAADGRPGELRRYIGLLLTEAVVTEEDIERVISGADDAGLNALPEDPLARAEVLLDRGRYNEAQRVLSDIPEPDDLRTVVARARLLVGMAQARAALELLQHAEPLTAAATPELHARWRLWVGRAYVGVGDYSGALERLEALAEQDTALGYEALAYVGLALGHVGEQDKAQAALERAVAGAREIEEDRVTALALACLGIIQEQGARHEDARETYRQAIAAAEAANDAGLMGSVELNLAGSLKISGDIAGALQHYESAVDMGWRSGRRATVRQALLNLANTDLYLGRLSRARSSIDTLDEQRDQLSPVAQAQLAGLKAEWHIRSGEPVEATSAYMACAEAYRRCDRPTSAAEARLEGVLAASRTPEPDIGQLTETIATATAELGDTAAHRPLLLLATARVQMLAEDEQGARESLEQALQVSREGRHREWTWRALEARAEVEQEGGQALLARRDREEALTVVEEIAARLPRDLREVFWNDSRRRDLRDSVEQSLGRAVTQMAATYRSDRSSTTSSISSVTRTPLEHSLAQILEINRELLGELDIERLTARVTEYAVDLLRAQRGFVLLRQDDGSLTVHTSRTRAGDKAHAEFSRSIAQRVMATQEPVVSINARQDASMQGYQSVHQLMLEAVACVPISSRGATPIGALYIEAPQRRGRNLERDVPTLRAFADQVALALDTARLVKENKERADELAEANTELEAAKDRLKELLGERTKKLNRARQKLRDARETLYGHFGYRGMVGTSPPMRRLYSLIDRVRETEVPVLVTGESGTGKELAARAIHEGSARSGKPFLGVNCAAIPEHLLESELFGNVRGAFTGADRERKGVIRECNGGTLLLDEIGEMPQKMQSGLLRVLQEAKVRPVGGASEIPVDVRLVFATHRDLAEMVKLGTFREDLYYRIHVVQLEMPALRQRLDDVPLLVDHFLRIFAARYKREKKAFTRAALRRLMTYDWPGNVRQLEHVLLNAWILSEEEEVDVDDIELPDGAPRRVTEVPPEESIRGAEVDSVRSAPSSRGSARSMNRPSVARRVPASTKSKHKTDEKQRILEALEKCNWNRVRAAEALGMARRTFYRRLREYDIQ